MIKIENINVYGWEPAIRGMRNPLNSWDKSDSYAAVNCAECGLIEERGICEKADRVGRCENFEYYYIGENDLKLMQQLSAAGDDDAKFLRMIDVTMDITAPQFWWAEFDTYKVGTVRNSCSKMHKIHVKEFSHQDFSHEAIYAVEYAKTAFIKYCSMCERLRTDFNATGDITYWIALIEALPEGYNMRATVQLNYQVLKNMYWARRNHKLKEWRDFCTQIKAFPYFKETCIEPVSYKNC